MRRSLPCSTRACGWLLAGLFSLSVVPPATAARAPEAPTPPQAAAEIAQRPVALPPADIMVGNR